MTTQLTAVRITASGAVYGGPTRIRAISYVGGAAAGLITLKNNSADGSGGTVIAVIDAAAGAGGGGFMALPGLGLKFDTNIYCTLGATAPVGVTFFLG